MSAVLENSKCSRTRDTCVGFYSAVILDRSNAHLTAQHHDYFSVKTAVRTGHVLSIIMHVNVIMHADCHAILKRWYFQRLNREILQHDLKTT